MRTQPLLILLTLTGLAATAAAEPANWSASWLFGTAWNVPGRLEIRQSGQDDLVFDAEFATRPFEQPLYWAVRINRQQGRHAWSLELHHHKLVLENPPPEVGSFSITHGTNIVSVQHAWLRPRWRHLLLAGVVIAHPENTVRGRKLPEEGGIFGVGYQLAGPALGVGAGARVPLTGWLDLDLEARITAAWLEVDVVDGRATHTNLALHFLVGPRIGF